MATMSGKQPMATLSVSRGGYSARPVTVLCMLSLIKSKRRSPKKWARLPEVTTDLERLIRDHAQRLHRALRLELTQAEAPL